jgi:molybdate transport system ATP-binding protein
MLEIRVQHRLGEFGLDAELDAPDRSVTAIVGESGSGKTTLLRLIAGLAHPERGRIVADGEVWFGDGRARHATARSVGYIPQNYALFPHLDARENVAFGLRAQGARAGEARGRADAALDRVGLLDLATRRPRELSGGQQQRVAIARAIVLEPRVLLMDEPMSALDTRTRRALRIRLLGILAELPCTTLYVTHHPGEALAFGRRIAVMDGGRIVQSGSQEALLASPRTPYIADFLGVNLFGGTLGDREGDGIRITLPEGTFVVGQGDATAIVRPKDVTISMQMPHGSARNVFAGTVQEIVPEPPSGDRMRVMLDTTPPLAAEITRETVRDLGLVPGARVYASFKASAVDLGR